MSATVRWARYAYVGLLWLFLAAITVQVLLAGLAIFGDPRDIGLHIQLGYILHLSPILVLIAAAVGRVGRPTLLWVGALVIVTLVQPLPADAGRVSSLPGRSAPGPRAWSSSRSRRGWP